VWYADGRRGEHNLGKHSLNTRNHDEALTNLRRLDRKKAIELDLATPVLVKEMVKTSPSSRDARCFWITVIAQK
jgi:hypothetical protein